MSYTVIFDGKGLVITFDENCDNREHRKANEECWEHPYFFHSKYHIWDMSKTSKITMEDDDALVAAKLDNAAFRQFKLIKIAIVTLDSDVERVCQIYAEHVDPTIIQSHVFHSLAEARDWVGSA
ncbi:hypothetical protein [Curvivirga aplysinae]|uniref:hypothetical protein n=1 Tax=Curvivirga aplysinae TaxID=2529852 RepID=UPI0012BC11AD|nr:hypothetical protein [Curvivirga aplysinae]MTI09210.1 hypothetical protein [Curvivirga aplysinae]